MLRSMTPLSVLDPALTQPETNICRRIKVTCTTHVRRSLIKNMLLPTRIQLYSICMLPILLYGTDTWMWLIDAFDVASLQYPVYSMYSVCHEVWHRTRPFSSRWGSRVYLATLCVLSRRFTTILSWQSTQWDNCASSRACHSVFVIGLN